MPEKEVHSAAGEVQNSLDSIAEMERAALQRAIPSPWLGAAIGLLSGALAALSVAGRQKYHLYVILVIGCVLVWESVNKRHIMGVSARHSPSKITAIELIILIPLYFLLVVSHLSGHRRENLRFFGDFWDLLDFPLRRFAGKWRNFARTIFPSHNGRIQ